MELIYWFVIVVLFVIAFIGLVYPIIPSVLFLLAGFLLYGVFFSFQQLGWLFWIFEGLFMVLLFIADYLTNLIGIKKYGGSKAGIWGSTIGILVGPFVIPVFGILIGPFIGAIAAELLFNRRSLSGSIKVGIGSMIGFISGIVAKMIIQAIMIGYFLLVVL